MILSNLNDLLNKNDCVLNEISLRFAAKNPVDNNLALAQVTTGDALREPMATKINDVIWRH